MSEKIYGSYRRKCSSCGLTRLVPNKREKCLECLEENLEIKAWQSVCLDCGWVYKKFPQEHKICEECLRKNLKRARKKLLATFNEEQKILCKEHDLWNEKYVSFLFAVK